MGIYNKNEIIYGSFIWQFMCVGPCITIAQTAHTLTTPEWKEPGTSEKTQNKNKNETLP